MEVNEFLRLITKEKTLFDYDVHDISLVLALLKDQLKSKEAEYQHIAKLRSTDIPRFRREREQKIPTGIYKKKP